MSSKRRRCLQTALVKLKGGSISVAIAFLLNELNLIDDKDCQPEIEWGSRDCRQCLIVDCASLFEFRHFSLEFWEYKIRIDA